MAALAVLIVGGLFAKDRVPPYPQSVIGPAGQITDRATILKGQNTYQRYGLMDHGSVWGHGSLRGMDFSALTLHKMGEFMREFHARQEFQPPFASLGTGDQERIRATVIREIKTNRYDPKTGTLELTQSQAFAFEELARFWQDLFRDGDPKTGFLPGTVPDEAQRKALSHFFFWTAWAAGTSRPGLSHTYTHSWPYDPTVGNQASPDALLWSILSILGLFVGLGAVVYLVHRYRFFYGETKGAQVGQKLLQMPLEASQVSAAKYFVVAGLLFVVRAWMEYGAIQKAGGDFPYRWPLYFLTASSFWNFLGAGVFGFMINLPIVNYYEHATYLTSNHGHTALFGVYGMLSLALVLFSWRSLVEDRFWNDKILKVSFWGLNGGLFLMFLTVLLPVGCYQVWKVLTRGLWYARSSDFYNLPLVQALGTWRMVPDLVIIVAGALPLTWFLVTTYPKIRRKTS